MFGVHDAHLLAMEAHAGQVDKQGRDYYLAHLLPIAEIARPYGPAAEIVAVLHDIVEDTEETLDSLRARGIPEEYVLDIGAVTRLPGEPYMSGLIPRSCARPRARLIKLIDNQVNQKNNADLAKKDPDKARSLLEGRYKPARKIMLKAEAADQSLDRPRVLV